MTELLDILQSSLINTLVGFAGLLRFIFGIFIWVVLSFIVARFLFKFLHAWWFDEVQSRFAEKEFDWVLLELRFPKENEVFPKAMENVFAAIYQIHSFGIKPEKKWLEGQFEESASFEMVSSREGIRFFTRLNKKFRPLFEKALFAQYPQAEIHEAAADYINEFPDALPNEDYDLLGTDMILGRDSAYPFKTYPHFFGERKFEEYEIDPIAHLAEVMSALDSATERMWVQIVISPVGSDLKDASKKVMDKMMGKKEEVKKGALAGAVESVVVFSKNLLLAPVRVPEWSAPKKEESREKSLNSVELEIFKAIDKKASKSAFKTSIRLLYIDRRDAFTKANFAAMTSSFQQFNSHNLNSFRPGPTITVPARFFRKKTILNRRKSRMYQFYISRSVYPYSNIEDLFDTMRVNIPILGKLLGLKKDLPSPFLLNTEELATLFHPPVTRRAQATGLAPIETRKAAPPANLPIEG